MTPKTRIIAIAVIALSLSTAARAASYYVSAGTGNDSWTGLLPSPNGAHTDGPFATLGQARTAMRASGTNKTAVIRAGTYSLSSGFAFIFSDNGQTWISYQGETPILDFGTTGTITLTGVNNIILKGLTIQNMGAGGLIGNGADIITLRWNKFKNCNQKCISGTLTNATIDSNTIDGQTSSSAPGTSYQAILLQFGSINNNITHNLIKNCQGGAISFTAGATDPANSNNLIDRNVIQNVNTNATDNGAIYIQDLSHSAVGNQITNNVINGNDLSAGYLTNRNAGIYLNTATSNYTITGNICRSCGEFAWIMRSGDHNTFSNNIFDIPSGAEVGLYQFDPSLDPGMASNVLNKNLIYLSGTVPASLYSVTISGSDVLPTDSNNLYWSPNTSTIPNTGIVDSSPVHSDPLFTQPSTGNYFMPSTSPAFTTVVFAALPIDQGPLAGPYPVAQPHRYSF